MDWPPLLTNIIGTVDQELLLCNEYLNAENRDTEGSNQDPVAVF